MVLPGDDRTLQCGIYTVTLFKASAMQQTGVAYAIDRYAKHAHDALSGFLAAAVSREDAETVVVLEGWNDATAVDHVEKVCRCPSIHAASSYDTNLTKLAD